MSDFEKIPTLEEFRINEDVDIPAELSQRYVAVKKQLADKETQKNVLVRQINQRDQEINILTKNLNAIESQAAQLQGKAAETKPATPAAGEAKPAANTTTTTTTTTPTKESKSEDTIEAILLEWEELDERLFGKKLDPMKPFLDAMDDLNLYPEDTEDNFGLGDDKYNNQQDRFNSDDLPTEQEGIELPSGDQEGFEPNPNPEEGEDFGLGDPNYGTDQDRFNESVDNDDIDIVEVDDQDDKDGGKVEEISPDYLFALSLNRPGDNEKIIAKVYRNEGDEFWKIRVVQGEEQPLEGMQFDPDMQMVDIIERLAEIYDEVEEVDVEDYEEMIDDKEENDAKYFNKK